MTADEFNNPADNHGVSSIGVSAATLVQLHKMGFKQVPLSADNEVVMPWTPIYEDPNYWTAERLGKSEEYSKFVNVATVFGKTHIKDEYGPDLYLNCLDSDSEYVYKVLTTPVEQLSWIDPILKSKVQNLIAKTGYEEDVRCLLDYLKLITYVVKTKKSYGVHVYWLSHKQNSRIRTEDCKSGYEFEIKTDKGSGHATLPPSTHRNDKNFRYYHVGRTDKIDTNDELYDIILELFAKDCLIKKEGHDSKYENKRRRASAIAITPYYQINPIILGQDQIIDSVNKLIDCYRERHRDPFTFEFSGLAFKQSIAEESAIAIIKELCIKANDPEINNRLDVIHRTYVNGANGCDISGSSGLRKVIAGIQGFDEQQAGQIIQSLIEIWQRYEIPIASLSLNKVSSLSDDQLDKIKILSEDIEYCINTILKETPNEQIPVRQLFVGMCSSSTHLPQNIGIRTQAGAGKNYMINKVISKFPQTNIIALSNMTPKALFHEYGTKAVKNSETGEYESLDSLIAQIDEKIENKQDEIANTKEGKKEKEKELKTSRNMRKKRNLLLQDP